MNYGGDAADQIVRYSLEGTEVALKLTGEAAKNFAVFAAAVLRDQKKMHGKTNLTRLLRENKPLRFFEVPESRMKEFAREAVPFPVSWTVKMKKKQKETQDILSYHTQAAGCSDKARAKASGGRQPIEECGRTGL